MDRGARRLWGRDLWDRRFWDRHRWVTLGAASVAMASVASGCSFVDGPGPVAERSTRVELVATPADGASVTPDEMNAAAEVIQERLEADGRRASDVVVDDATIVLEVVGELSEEARSLISRPGELTFRPVLLLGAPDPDGGPQGHDRTGVAPDVWAEFEALDCAAPGNLGSGDPDRPLVTCDQEGDVKYLLGPVDVDGTELTDVGSGPLPGPDGAEAGEWGVNLQLDDRGTEAFRETTERLQGLSEPRNQIALTLDGLVISAPTLPPGVVITTGELQITGSFTEESADTLAKQLASDPLPFPFEVRDISEPAE
jgi:preprotein translocase subunit SecD